MALSKGMVLSAAVAALLMTGCTHRITDFTVISTKNVDWSHASNFTRSNRVKGEDNLYFLAAIPLGSSPNVKEAIDNAIENVPGAVALTDGVLYQRFWHIGITGNSAFVVEGTPLIDPSLQASLPSNYIIAKWDEATQSFKNEYVSAEEYAQFKAEMLDGAEKVDS